jgi:hypothetical protein
MICIFYALRGGAPRFSVLTLLVAVASVAIYPLTVFPIYLDEGRRNFVNHPLFAFVLPSDTGKSLLARVMEGAFYLHRDMPPPYLNGVGPCGSSRSPEHHVTNSTWAFSNRY